MSAIAARSESTDSATLVARLPRAMKISAARSAVSSPGSPSWVGVWS
ncbi:MAG: hypothetical protein WKF57_14165 [Nakamurella sp.]